MLSLKRKTEPGDTRGIFKLKSKRQTDNKTAKTEKRLTKQKKPVYNTQDRKLKTEKHEPQKEKRDWSQVIRIF